MTAAFEEVMEIRGKGLPRDGEVEITGADPVFSTQFKIGETCAAVLAGVGVAVSDIWMVKTGRRQSTAIDARRAAAEWHSVSHGRRCCSWASGVAPVERLLAAEREPCRKTAFPVTGLVLYASCNVWGQSVSQRCA